MALDHLIVMLLLRSFAKWVPLHLYYTRNHSFSVCWGCRIHRLLLCRGVRPLHKECRDGEISIKLELWGMQSTPSLLSLPGPLWPGMVAYNRVLSMGQIELNCIQMLKWTTWNRTFLKFGQLTCAGLNCLKSKCLCMLNLIVWNRTFLTLKLCTYLNWIVWNRTALIFNCG